MTKIYKVKVDTILQSNDNIFTLEAPGLGEKSGSLVVLLNPVEVIFDNNHKLSGIRHTGTEFFVGNISLSYREIKPIDFLSHFISNEINPDDLLEELEHLESVLDGMKNLNQKSDGDKAND